MKTQVIIFSIIIFSLLTVSFICNLTNTETREQNNLVLKDTEWELVFIEALEGYVFPDYEGSVWEVPEDEWYIIYFLGEREVRADSFCNTCGGEYTLSPPDSISIDWVCTRAVCGRSTEFNGILINSKTFEVVDDALRIYYKQEPPWPELEGILHFVKRELNK